MNKPTGRDNRTLLGARAGLAGALWIVTSLALGGCAQEPHVTPAFPKAPAPSMEAAPPPVTDLAPLDYKREDLGLEPRPASLELQPCRSQPDAQLRAKKPRGPHCLPPREDLRLASD
jgi:hypothetical protein